MTTTRRLHGHLQGQRHLNTDKALGTRSKLNMADTFDLFRRLSVGTKFSKRKCQNNSNNLNVSLNNIYISKDYLGSKHKIYLHKVLNVYRITHVGAWYNLKILQSP